MKEPMQGWLLSHTAVKIVKKFSILKCLQLSVTEFTQENITDVRLLSVGTNAELSRHKETHDSNRPMFKCEQCPSALVSRNALELHVIKRHKPGKIFLVCEICGGHVSNM